MLLLPSNILTVKRSTSSKYFFSVSESSVGLELLGTKFTPTLLLDSSLDLFREWVEGVEGLSVLWKVILLSDASITATLTLMVLSRSSLLTMDEGGDFVSEDFPLNIVSTCSVSSLAFFWSSFALCWTSRSSVSIAEKYVFLGNTGCPKK